MSRVNGHHATDAADFAAGTPMPPNAECNPMSAAPVLNNIPQKIRAVPRWVTWKYAARNGKATKVPYNARTGTNAASDNPHTWSSFEQAIAAFEMGGYAGIGFVLGDGWVGIDLDHCVDPETGEIKPWALEIITAVNSYAEKSPSATGVHILAEGRLPDGRRRAGDVEMYDCGRYFTVTGNLIGGYREIGERQAEVAALHARIFANNRKNDAKASGEKSKSDVQSSPERLVLDPGANPPFEKFEMLCDVERRFKLSWEHKRPDLRDSSQSAHDQSLANFSAMAGWSDQEITDLIIANRRRFGADLKLREDYYRRTIARAREVAEPFMLDQEIAELVQPDSDEQDVEPTAGDGTTSTETPEDAADEAAVDNRNEEQAEQATAAQDQKTHEAEKPDNDTEGQPTEAATEAKRRTLIELLSKRFKVPITRVVKYNGEPGLYRLETMLGAVQLGGVAGLINQSKLRVSIADATGRYLPLIDPDKWPAFAQALLTACEVVERGADATLNGTMAEWLRAYLSEKSIHEKLAAADEGKEPFFDDGDVIIFSNDFKRWLQIRQNERVTQNRLTGDLRAFGAVPHLFKAVIKGKPTTRSVWRLPQGPWIPNLGGTGAP